ncbi:hypothetical protein [Halostella pelagica]|uniref:hypothetical protein n=1 Tax=Halostella pelagica TaxID=2583824 RepID=UPI001081419E|nr:hypothetical protein [Halostella pelagica]
MDVNDALREIDAAKDGALTEAARRKSQYDHRRQAYKKALREARAIAGDDAARELADWIEATIRDEKQLPRAREVRQKGADICRDRGKEVSTGSWLGA